MRERWIALITHGFHDHPTTEELLRIWIEIHSHDFPMLYFQNAENHGWEYTIYFGGIAVATVTCNYNVDRKMVVSLLIRKKSDVNLMWLNTTEGQELLKQVRKSEEYKSFVKSQYDYANPEQFTLFGFPQTTIDQLKKVLTVNWYNDEKRRLQQVNKFRELIDASDMEWENRFMILSF